MDNGGRFARNELFQELKPRCVELSQLSLRDDGSASNLRALIKSTTLLLEVLEGKCKRIDGVFDEKLADYVFFPVSQILRRKQKYTDRLSELTIKCTRILLEYGWRKSIGLDLGKQLLILLTFVAGGVPGKESTPAPEELMIEAFGALAALFRDLAVTQGGSASLIEPGTVPAFGHCITVLLEGITDGPQAAVQLQALKAFDAVWHCLKDQQTLSTFLPGTISALTKSLMPSTASRRTRKTLVEALEVLGYVLSSVLSDVKTRNIRRKDESSTEVATAKSEKNTLTKSWLKATASQIKLALSNVIKLRSHESLEVRKALNFLCIRILDECHDTLSESSSMLVETCMTLAGLDAEDSLNERSTSLTDLAIIHPDLSESVKSTVYNWVTSLPRVMQGNDETAKINALGQLSKAHTLLQSLNIESSILDDALGSSLRDSITASVEPLSQSVGLQEAGYELNSQAVMSLTTDNALSLDFRPIIMAEESQKQTRTQLMTLLSNLGSRESQIHLASEMLEYARGALGPSLLSAYWLSSQILKSAASTNQEFDEFFESSLTLSDEQEVVNQELFSYSLSVLANNDDTDQDWRLQAIALEVIADAAQRMKESFRTELVDTLYPVAQLLGSSNSQLRSHAITTLNMIARSCNYTSASELITKNSDYMVNAISLRLNTFNISPQAPQVLIMMIRLTGPSLLPYLDDVVSSIFAALDNFHGYTRLVEVLFAVLGEIVSVGSKSTQLLLESTPPKNHKKVPPPTPTIEDIIALLTPKPQPKAEPHEPFPTKTWKSAKSLLDGAENPPSEDDEEPSQESQQIAKPPQTKTQQLLISITNLTQHYLTSPSPLLRSNLLTLLATVMPSLAIDEDILLPSINTTWPVLTPLLEAKEQAYIQISAASTISLLCQYAGDFMSSRIIDLWPTLLSLSKSAKLAVEKEKGKKGGRGRYSEASKVWEAMIALLVGVVGYTEVGDEGFDDVLDVLGDVVFEKGREGVREVLEGVNGDAVWLEGVGRGWIKVEERPGSVEGLEFVLV